MPTSDSPTPPRRPPYALLSMLLVVLVGYLTHEVASLRARAEDFDRQRLLLRDQLLAENESLARELALVRGALASGRAFTPGPEATGATTPATPSPAPSPDRAANTPPPSHDSKPPAASITDYLERHLFPGDAVIAEQMVLGTPAAEIARRTRHSPAFVVAKGIAIEQMLKSAPDAPPELLATIKLYLDRAGRPR